MYLLYAFRVFPVPGTDSSSFLPPALSYAKGKGLTNPFYYLSSITDKSGRGLYNYYVPFYSWMLGVCVAAVHGIKTIFVVCASVTILTLYRRALLAIIPAASSNNMITAVICLSIPYLATYSLPTIGRPEQLTVPMALALYLIYQNRQQLPTWIYNSFLVAILAILLATQITGFYFAFLVFLVSETLQPDSIRRLAGINAIRTLTILLL